MVRVRDLFADERPFAQILAYDFQYLCVTLRATRGRRIVFFPDKQVAGAISPPVSRVRSGQYIGDVIANVPASTCDNFIPCNLNNPRLKPSLEATVTPLIFILSLFERLLSAESITIWRLMSFLVEIFLLLFVYSVTWYVLNKNNAMDRDHVPLRFRGRGGRRTVLPSYPHHNRAETTSEISGPSDAENKEALDDNNERKDFYPCLKDVSQVREILCRLWSTSSTTSTTAKRRSVMLPDEVIDIILDEAEYWPSVVTKLNTIPFVIAADGDTECLKTPPLCYSLVKDRHKEDDASSSMAEGSARQVLLHRGIHPCRKIVFDISSHDQGWGGDSAHRGTFQGSWTWFDAYIRPSSNKEDGADEGRRTSDSTTSTATATTTMRSTGSDSTSEGAASTLPRPFLPEPTKLQSNRTAVIGSTDFHIVWHYLDELAADSPEAEQIERETGRGRATLNGIEVRNMKVGDEVSVWLRARFAGWRNHVDKMTVRVFWAA